MSDYMIPTTSGTLSSRSTGCAAPPWTALNEDRRMLSREQRLPVVVALREDGHSQTAIAGALGVSDRQVRFDLAASGAESSSPDRVTGLDGKTYPAAKAKPKPKPGNGRRGYRKEKDAPDWPTGWPAEGSSPHG